MNDQSTRPKVNPHWAPPHQLPPRSPVLEAADQVDKEEAQDHQAAAEAEATKDAQEIEEAAQMAQLADEAHRKALQRRGEARADALTVVARARVRGMGDATIWSVDDADAAYNIADSLLQVQGSTITEVDPAYAPRSEATRVASSSVVERAIRAKG